MNILRRLPLSRLLLLCGLVAGIGVSATALAFALGGGPKPPAKPLAQAVHDALSAPAVEGVSASITLSNHLLEGANLASGSAQGSGLASSPLLTGASGRLWIAKDGRARLELQAEKGDTQVIYDGHTVSIYDAASNTLYRYTPPSSSSTEAPESHAHEVPTVAKIEEAITHLDKHASLSGAKPDDVAGQAAYTVRVSPNESGSLIGGAELSFDAANGVPLRTAIYSSTGSSPVIELAATEISFGPVAGSVFQFTPPANAKVEEITLPSPHTSATHKQADQANKPKLTTHGHGIAAVAELESKASAGSQSSSLEGLPKVSINGAGASELRTELGTLLTFERSGVRYLFAGSVTPSSIEALARGL
ncbi:MAG: LolA family protein [Solirubrobacteraceae bacterium]